MSEQFWVDVVWEDGAVGSLVLSYPIGTILSWWPIWGQVGIVAVVVSRVPEYLQDTLYNKRKVKQ